MNINSVEVVMPDLNVMKQWRSLRDLMPDKPFIRYTQDTILTLVDLFKIVLASLLSVFVPQTCDDTHVCQTLVAICSLKKPFDENCNVYCNEDHSCSMEENFSNLSSFNTAVIVWNFISFAVMLFHYFHMWRRERYMVTHLHENYIHSRVNLKDVVHDYPTVEKKMMYFNQLVLTTTLISICFQSVNIVISGVFLFGTQYYSGFKTATSFIANILLIVSLLWNAFNSSYVSKKHKLAYSCVAYIPVSYNTVDEKFMHK